MSIKEGRKRASAKSQKGRYPKRMVVAEREIRELAAHMKIREVRDAALCLLIIDEAARAIGAQERDAGKLNLRLIKQMAGEEKCTRVRRVIKAMIAAVEQGAEGVLAARLTITCFMDFAFEYVPGPGVAARLYKSKLSRIRQAAQSSR